MLLSICHICISKSINRIRQCTNYKKKTFVKSRTLLKVIPVNLKYTQTQTPFDSTEIKYSGLR